MISIEQQQKLLLNISTLLERPVTAYAVGGTAMMFLGLKDTTLDIDLVFKTEKDRETFEKAAKKLGYRKIDATRVYSVKRNTPDMLKLNNERFDLFVNEVIDFFFSDKMCERAEQMHQFKDKLTLKIANPHDILLMKCATDRIKDIDDARTIIKFTNINWNTIIEETKNQIRLGKERAAFDLGYFLEKLMKQKQLKKKIPKYVLDKIFKIVKRQLKKKKKK